MKKENIQSVPCFTDQFRAECNKRPSIYRVRVCYNNKVHYINDVSLIARDYVNQNKLVLIFNNPKDMESALEECAALDYENNSFIELMPGVKTGVAFRVNLLAGMSVAIESVNY